MVYEKAVIKLFHYFHDRVYREHKQKFRLNLEISNQRKVIENFVNLIIAQVNLPGLPINYLVDYFCFSFHYWSTKVTKREVTLSWIIGKKTFSKWLEKKDGTNYYTDKFLKEYNIDLHRLRQELSDEKEAPSLDVSEEVEKNRFVDPDAKLYNCTINTTMYNHRSINCLGCQNKQVCKSMLKDLFPQLYKKRGYE